jgi:hypothetical protein
MAAAEAAREEAVARRESARAERESARSSVLAGESAKAEAAARERSAVLETGVQPGMALIPHPTQYGRGADAYRGDFPPPGARNYPRNIYGVGGAGNESPAGWIGPRGGRTTVSPDQVRQAQRYQASLTSATPAVDRMAAAETRLGASTRRSAVEMETASQANMKHGALSAEYIMAAVRGETTLRELGDQALVTAGKFGAWTTAATAIYAVAGAIHEVGQGAIDSASGLGQLHRFIPDANPDQAQQGYRDLSRYANVPIKDAADAQAQMARIYHDQKDSQEAARAALIATKLDNISTADSYQYLTAGATGFGLSARQLMGVIEQLNALHNKMGARVSETVPAFGRAAAAVKNAGGEYNQYLAIIATMQRASGLTGLNVATILGRSATRFVPANRQAIEKFGLDPHEGFTQLLIDAVRKAQTLSPENRRKLAEALGGPQLGSRGFVGLLSRPDLLGQSLNILHDPQGNARLLEHERVKILGTPAEELHKIPAGLQRIGSALGESGAGSGAALLLHTLNGILSTVTRLIELFDHIPNPLRTTLAVMLEIAAVTRLLGRFGASIPLLNRLTPERREAGFITRGQRAAVRAATDERERVTRQYSGATEAEARTRGQIGTMRTTLATAEMAPAERAALEQKIAVAEETLNAQIQRSIQLELEAEQARMRVVEELNLQAALEAEKKRAGAAGVRAYAEREGLYRTQEAGAPSALGAAPVGGAPPQREAVGAHTGLPMIVPAGVTDAEAGVLADGERQVATRTEAAARQMERLGVSGSLLAGATRKGGAVFRSAGPRLSRVADGLKGMGRDLLGAIGPLDAVIGAFLIVDAVHHAVESAQDQANGVIAQLDKTSPADDPAAVARLRDKASGGFHPLRSAQNAFATVASAPIDLLSHIGGHGDAFIETQNQVAQEIAKTEQSEIDFIKRMQQTQGAMLFAGQIDTQLRAELARIKANRPPTQPTVPLTGTPDLLGNLSHLQGMGDTPSLFGMGRLPQLGSSQKQIADAYQRAIKQTKDSIAEFKARGNAPKTVAALQAELGRLQGELTQVNAGHPDRLHTEWGALTSSPKVFAQRVKQDSDAMKSYFNEFGKLRGSYGMPDLRVAYQVAKRQAKLHPTAGNLANLNAVSSALQGLGQDVLSRYQTDMQSATDAQDRAAAFERAMAQIHRMPKGRERREATRQLQQSSFQADQQARQIQEQYDESRTEDPQAKAAIAVKSAAKGVREAARKFGVGSDQWKQAMTTYNGALDQQYQAAEQSRQVSEAFAESGTQDELTKANIALRSAAGGVKKAAQKYGVGSDHWKQAMTAYNQAADQHQSVLLDRLQAQNQIREATVSLRTGGDPVAVAGAALQSSRSTVAFLKAHHADPGKIAQAVGGVMQNTAAYAQAAHDQAQQLAQIRFQTTAARHGDSPEADARAAERLAAYERGHARNGVERAQALLDTVKANNQAEQVAVQAEQARYAVLESLTDDPVEQANIRVHADRYALRHAHGTTQRRTARAQLNTDQHALRDARLQSREDDIEFDLDMDKITREQAIRQYRSILQSHNLTKAQRREIMRRIKALRDESDQEASGFGLQVGQGVKLPTIYDVRRAISGAKQAANQGTQVNARTAVTVNVEVTDPNSATKVFDAIDGALNTGVRSTMRTAGLSL